MRLLAVTGTTSLIGAQKAVSSAISKGELDIESGAVLAKLLADLGSTTERFDIEKRLVAVEERIAKKG